MGIHILSVAIVGFVVARGHPGCIPVVPIILFLS